MEEETGLSLAIVAKAQDDDVQNPLFGRLQLVCP